MHLRIQFITRTMLPYYLASRFLHTTMEQSAQPLSLISLMTSTTHIPICLMAKQIPQMITVFPLCSIYLKLLQLTFHKQSLTAIYSRTPFKPKSLSGFHLSQDQTMSWLPSYSIWYQSPLSSKHILRIYRLSKTTKIGLE
jgi:hypothetical protein